MSGEHIQINDFVLKSIGLQLAMRQIYEFEVLNCIEDMDKWRVAVTYTNPSTQSRYTTAFWIDKPKGMVIKNVGASRADLFLVQP
jgi:predicted site-specific integrase-resolvase